MKKSFLVALDYGQGGLWAYVQADSAEAIKRRFPELEVFRRAPDWMTPAVQEELRKSQSYDLDEEPRGLLERILRARTGGSAQES